MSGRMWVLVALPLAVVGACSTGATRLEGTGGTSGPAGSTGSAGTSVGGGGGDVGGAGGAPQPPLEMYGLAYGNGTYVATGVDDETKRGIIYASADGLAWQRVADGLTSHPLGVAYGNGRFVAVASQFTSDVGWLTQAFASDDGRTWTTTDLPGQATGVHLAFGDGQFVAVATQSHLRSTDGITWTPFGPAGPGSLSGGVVFAAGRFLSWSLGVTSVAIFENGGWSNAVVTSSGALDDLRAVGDRFIGITKKDCCLGEDPSAIRWGRVSSADGVTWTDEATELTARPPLPAYDDGSICVALSRSFSALPAGVAVGDTCESLIAVDTSGPLLPFDFLRAGGLFVASGQYGIITSGDGRVWTRRL